MFPIVNNLNQLSSAINTLNQEVAKLKGDKTTRMGTDSLSLKASIDNIKDDLNKNVIDLSASINDIKRSVENFKLEITRDIGMIEATILRKCESSMNKMVSDRINIAIESQKNTFKDIVDHEIEQKLQAINAGLTLPDPTELDPFDITIGDKAAAPPAAPATSSPAPSAAKRTYARQRGSKPSAA
jgi:hypothetical protein